MESVGSGPPAGLPDWARFPTQSGNLPDWGNPPTPPRLDTRGEPRDWRRRRRRRTTRLEEEERRSEEDPTDHVSAEEEVELFYRADFDTASDKKTVPGYKRTRHGPLTINQSDYANSHRGPEPHRQGDTETDRRTNKA